MNGGLLFAVSALSFVMPAAAAGQGPVRVQAAVGTHISDGGNSQSIAIGFLPDERWEILISAERFHVPTEVRHFNRSFSARRGGTTRFISGEVRFVPVTFNRISPYLLISAGRGISRPNVNNIFPDPVTNDALLLFGGGGFRLAVASRLSAFADIRFGFQGERDSIYSLMPVRGGVAWRF
jgi:hypothetical protein